MPVRGLYANREFHVPFRFMTYLTMKFKVDAIVSFRNINLFSIVCKTWTIMERGHVVHIHTPCKHYSNFWVLNMSNF